MKATILAQFFPPETFAGANRIHALAAALGREAAVTVVAPQPSYPDAALYRRVEEPEAPANVRVRRVAAFVPHGRSCVSRALGEQRLAWQLAATARRDRADVVVVSSPAMFLGPAGAWLARLHCVPFVWDVRDITWEYARETAAGSRAAETAAGALCRLMWAVASRADLLVAATPGIARQLETRCPGKSVVTLQNVPAEHMLDRLDPSEPPPRSVPLVTYAGLVGRAQQLSVLCDVAARLPGVQFAVAGQGPELPTIVEQARARRLANLHFHGYVTPERLAAVYHESAVLFAQLHASPLHTSTALPSKLFEYMAAGRPVVYAGEGLAAETVREIDCGLAVPPGDGAAIAAAIESLLRDRMRARMYGLAGRSFVESQPSREDRMAELLPFVRRLAHKNALVPVAA